MRFGICCSPDRGSEYLEAGFDYVELPAVALANDPGAYGNLRVDVTNVFFPGSIHLIGSDPTPYRGHAKKVIEAAATYGVSIMVLGSGGSRRAPPETTPQDAEKAFIDVAAELDSMAQAHGIRVCPESLNKSETNVGNDLGLLARALNANGLNYTADAYHVLRECGASPNWEDQLPHPPAHVHFASVSKRTFEPDDPMLVPFFDRLQALSYNGRISFEGGLDGVPAAQLLRWLRDRLGD